jgi:hypothetical protein
VIVVLFWVVVAWLVSPLGAVGHGWWQSAGQLGQLSTHSGTGTVVGLLLAGALLLALAESLGRDGRVRRAVGASSVTLAIVLLAGMGWSAWLISLVLVGLAGANAAGRDHANAAGLAVLGILLGGSHGIRGLVIGAIVGTNHGQVTLERLMVVVVLIAVGVGVLFIAARRTGWLGEAWLVVLWRRWTGLGGKVRPGSGSTLGRQEGSSGKLGDIWAKGTKRKPGADT